MRTYSKICGFTLVELVAALAVVSVLVVAVTPTYQSSVARSRRGEARVNLQEIASLQGIYVMENDVYATLPPRGHTGGGAYVCDDGSGEDNALGFRPEDCRSMRYGYKSDGGGTGFDAVAQATQPMNVYPGCTSDDILELKHNTEIRVCMDAVKNCPGDGDVGNCTVSSICSTSYSAWGACVHTGQDPANVCPPGTVPGTRDRTKTVTCPTTPPTVTTTTESEACSIPGTRNCTTTCPTPACSLGGDWVDGSPPNCCVCSLTTCPAGKTLNTSNCSCDCPVATVNACNTSGGTLEDDCSCTPPCSSCTSWPSGVADPNAWGPACDEHNPTGTQTQDVTVNCNDPNLSHCEKEVTKTQDCPCSSCTSWPNGDAEIDPSAWTPACNTSNLTGTQTQDVTVNCDDPGLSSRCTQTVTKTQNCPCDSCTSWTEGTPGAWDHACDASNTTGKQTRIFPETCNDPGRTHCTRDGRTEEKDCPCSLTTHCCDQSNTSIWRWGGGTCAAENTYNLNTVACLCEPIETCDQEELKCLLRDVSGAIDNSSGVCRSCSINTGTNTKEWNTCTCPSCTTAEEVCRLRNTSGNPDLTSSECRECSINTGTNAKEWNTCNCPPCNYNCDAQCNPWDFGGMRTEFDPDRATVAANTCVGTTVFALGTAIFPRTCPGECPDSPCPKEKSDPYGENVTGTKPLTTCEDGCNAWGEGANHDYTGTTWWATVWNALQGLVASTNRMWQVTWDGGKDPSNSDDIASKCAAAGNPADVTFNGNAVRTRTCPTPPGVLPICLESGCETEDETAVSVTVNCGCSSYDCDTQCTAWTPAAPYSNSDVSSWETGKDPTTIAANTCQGDTGMANGSVSISRTCNNEPAGGCCLKAAQRLHRPTVSGTKITACDDGCGYNNTPRTWSGWTTVWEASHGAGDGHDPADSHHNNHLCTVHDGVANGVSTRTRTCPAPGILPACLEAGCHTEENQDISQLVDCPVVPLAQVDSPCECNLAVTSKLCRDPVSASGHTFPSLNSYCVCDEDQVQLTDTNSDGTISVAEKKAQVAAATCSNTNLRGVTESVLCPTHPDDIGASASVHASVHTDVANHDHCHHTHVNNQGVVDSATMASDCTPLPYVGWTSHTHSQGPYTIDSYSRDISCQLKNDGITCKCDVTLD